MKHISLLNRGTPSNGRSSTFGRQLLVDEDDYYDVNDVVNFPYNDNHIEAVGEIDGEGTECVIGTRTPTAIGSTGNVPDTTATNRYIDDDEFHPPMCGQLFLTKVIGNNGGGGITRKQQSKTKELNSPRRSYNRRNPMLRLTQNKKKNQLTKIVMSSVGYHETFSAEQSPDSESETSSVQSYNDRVRVLSSPITTQTCPNATAAAGSHDARHRQSSSSNRSCGGDSDTTSSLPSHIVQFDPSELELIKTEKVNADKNASKMLTSMSSDKPSEVNSKNHADSSTSSLLEIMENQSAATKSKVVGGRGKQGHTVATSLSPFQSTVLPTVAEEKSFDLIESPSSSSAASNYKLVTSIAVTSDQKISNLLPTASSSFSSGDEDEDVSAFFGCNTNHQGNRDLHDDSVDADDDDDEIRDDRETVTMSQFGCFSPTNHEKEAFFSSSNASRPNHNSVENVPQESNQLNREISYKSEAKNLKSTQKDSPEMMEILDAMRQIILKQQDAIQAISDENVEFRNQLALCHREMKTLQGESSDQLVQITQLVIQKNSLDVETTQLKDELGRLKDEILRLKSDDADLVNRFESLMNNHDDTTDDDTTVDKVDKIVVQFNKQQRDRHNISPLKHTNDHTSESPPWRQILGPSDDTSSASLGRNDIEPKNVQMKSKNTKSSMTEETVDSTIVEAETSSSTNPASITTGIETILPVLETAKIANDAIHPSKPLEHHVSKDKDVTEFKNRLGEIQKKRMMRTGSSVCKDNSNHADANSNDRKTFTVRFL